MGNGIEKARDSGNPALFIDVFAESSSFTACLTASILRKRFDLLKSSSHK